MQVMEVRKRSASAKQEITYAKNEGFGECTVEMAWAAKRPANEPLTDLFIGPLTALFYLCLLLGR